MMAGSAAEIKLLEYKDTITQLNTLLTAQTELNRSLQKTVKDLRQDNKNLMEQIDYLTKKLLRHFQVKKTQRHRRSAVSV